MLCYRLTVPSTFPKSLLEMHFPLRLLHLHTRLATWSSR